VTRATIATLQDLRAFAAEIANKGGDYFIVLLEGPMGAGKTQFTKYFLEAMGSQDAVSPSFAIHNSYKTATRVVHHFDLFRLESSDDLESTGFWDLFSEGPAWVVIEWADKLSDFGIRDMLPAKWPLVELKFTVDHEGLRSIETAD
jgi:tRNA threonylcarbamoyladenosine biosynthesis protein TsaE